MKRLQDREDRISQLSEPILHHVLSFLPIKSATQTRVLSKTWDTVWSSFPVLDFSQYEYRNSNKKIQNFCKYVDKSIARRPPGISIRKFHLRVYFDIIGPKSRSEDLTRWLNYAISNNVEDLVLHVYSTLWEGAFRQYPLSVSTLYRAKSLKELDLVSCELVTSGIRSDVPIEFPLRKLKLAFVDIDEHTLQNLLSNSFSLEELRLRDCWGFQSVSISSAKLKSVDLYHRHKIQDQKIAFEAPNLQILKLGGGFASVLSSRLEASKYNKNLKELVLSNIDITDDIFRVIQEFGVLEKLELIECCLQTSIYRLSNLAISETIRLKNVEIVVGQNCYSRKRVIEILPPGLYQLEIDELQGMLSEEDLDGDGNLWLEF